MNFFLDGIKQYVNFSGRATRQQYWMYYLFYLIFFILLTVMDIVIGVYDEMAGIGLLSGVFAIALLIPSLAIGARRLHDIGRSGWWLLLYLIPLIGPLIIFIFALLDSSPTENQWGPSLKYGESENTEVAAA